MMYVDVNKQIPDSVRQEIDRRLNEIEADQGVKIIYACESGSRAWGFASMDSDYDVRFLYVRPQNWYLSVFEQRDVIEPGIDNAEVIYDLSGWDIKKAFALLRNSNGPLIEWLNSPIVYRSETTIEFIKAIQAEIFLPRNTVYHYLSMAKRLFKRLCLSEQAKLKTYFYILRASLCALYIKDENSVPPVLFSDLYNRYLVDSPLGDKVAELIELKSSQAEKDRIARVAELDDYIANTLANIGAAMPEHREKADKGQFNRAFIQTVNALDTKI